MHFMKRKPKTNLQTKQKSLLEVEELRTRLDATERRLQEASKTLQVQVAERERAEKTFEKAQEYTKSIVETIRNPLLVLTADLKVITANRSFYEMFHVPPEETEGRFVYNIGDHSWDIPALRELLEKIVPQNTQFNDFEVDHEFPTLGRKTMLLNARRIYREDKGTDKILLAFEDITDQRQMGEVLKSSEKRYRRLFETAQDGILILDAETGQITDVNPFLVEMLGYSHKYFLGKRLWEIGAFKDIKASKAAFLELQSKGYVRYNDLPLETKDGRPMAVEFISNVYLVNHHKVIQCNIRDITGRKLLGDALQKAHNELEQQVEKRTEELRVALSEIKTTKDKLEAENIYFHQENKRKHRFENIIGKSDGLKYVLYRVEQVAPQNTTVLILGEDRYGEGADRCRRP
jgi:PAS domain S-box-containing protein